VAASKVSGTSQKVNVRSRSTNAVSCLAVVCLAGVLLSVTVQTTHFCGLYSVDAQTSVTLDPAPAGSSNCLTCLLAPSISALVLLLAFFIMAGSALFVSGLQMCPKPVLYSFRLHIRPPPPVLA
jgi:hypothetical protein